MSRLSILKVEVSDMKMIYSPHMRKYELTVVMGGKATTAKKQSVSKSVSQLVDSVKGKIVKEEDWGKKTLSYKIKKTDTGMFLYFILELNPESVKLLDKELKLKEEIIRYLLIRYG
ncbi:30S ribosomal protein S6 [Candidatus Woesebacteria bacterium]|nr:30S ribosomal protein S6 [Candidatus Woesebacteria bacterium]